MKKIISLTILFALCLFAFGSKVGALEVSNFEDLKIKNSLIFNYEEDLDIFSVTNAKIRFGIEIPTNLYDEKLSYGLEYRFQTELNDQEFIDVNLAPELDGDIYRASGVFKLTENLFTQKIDVKMYVIKDSTKSYTEMKTTSFIDVVEIYINEYSTNNNVKPHLTILNYLKNKYNPQQVENKLTDIQLDDISIIGFDSLRLEYFVQYPKGTTTLPKVTFTASNQVLATNLTMPQTVNDYIIITVGGGDDIVTYKVFIYVAQEDELTMGWPDMTFDSPDTPLGRDWGFDRASIVSEKSHSGIKAAENGSGGWVGIGLGEVGSGYPAKGQSLKAGAWVYVDETAKINGAITIEIYGKEAQGQIEFLEYFVTSNDLGKWIYIETEASDVLAENADYVQIVVKNWTNSVAYFDDITLKVA